MSDQLVVFDIFPNEVEAGMAQQALQAAGLNAFISKMMVEIWSLIFNGQAEFAPS